MTAPQAPMPVEIWSDLVCPFCWIGKRRLEEAVRRLGLEGQVEVVLRAFELDPNLAGPAPLVENLARKYGGRDNVLRMFPQVRALGAEVGLTFDFEGAIAANTFDAHRLLVLAREHGLASALSDRLMQAHFQERADLSEQATLRRLALEAGLEGAAVDALLASDACAGEVRAEEAQARAHGTTGVPFMVIDGKYAVQGAQPVELYMQALSQARDERRPPLAFGDATTASGTCGEEACVLPSQA